MARRRGRTPPAEKVKFPGVGDRITALEASVYNATFGWDICLQDFLTWLFPAEMVQKLTDAFPYGYRRAFNSIALHSVIFEGMALTFSVNGEAARLITPCPGVAKINMQHPNLDAIRTALLEIEHLHCQFRKVHEVATWMEHHATPGAARYYWPAMCMLLPAEHEINQSDGQRYKEPKESIAHMIPLIRETAAILTGAKLAEQVPTRAFESDTPIVTVCTEMLGVNSQVFRLL